MKEGEGEGRRKEKERGHRCERRGGRRGAGGAMAWQLRASVAGRAGAGDAKGEKDPVTL